MFIELIKWNGGWGNEDPAGSFDPALDFMRNKWARGDWFTAGIAPVTKIVLCLQP